MFLLGFEKKHHSAAIWPAGLAPDSAALTPLLLILADVGLMLGLFVALTALIEHPFTPHPFASGGHARERRPIAMAIAPPHRQRADECPGARLAHQGKMKAVSLRGRRVERLSGFKAVRVKGCKAQGLQGGRFLKA